MGAVRNLPLLLIACSSSLWGAEILVQGPGFQLSTADVEAELAFQPPQRAQAIRADPDQMRALIDALYRREALVQEAENLGLEKDPKARYRLERARKETLVAIALDHAREQVMQSLPDFTARAEELYQAKKERYRIPERVRVRHILLRAATPAAKEQRRQEAESILKRLAQGERFEDLAKALSEDPGSASKGGDLGWLTRGKTVPAFEKAAFSLQKPGEHSGIVPTRFGLHIIQLESRVPSRLRTFEEVKNSLISKLRMQYIRDAVERWRKRIVDPKRAKTNPAALEAYIEATVRQAQNSR